jgi:hypothetical protein
MSLNDQSRTTWRKSSYSSTNGGECVEIAENLPNVVAVRDSKNPGGPEVVFNRVAFRRLVDEIRSGGHDL